MSKLFLRVRDYWMQGQYIVVSIHNLAFEKIIIYSKFGIDIKI